MKKKQSHRRKINRKIEKRLKWIFGYPIKLMPPRWSIIRSPLKIK